MKLRKLEKKDAQFMLEWMHDSSVVRDLKVNFMEKTLEDCDNFICKSQVFDVDCHLAVVNDNDEYMGTVSLKHIDGVSAELGIVIRSVAMGMGYSRFAMEEILKVAFEELHLQRVFWCVSRRNERAIRFYDKNGYLRTILGLGDTCEYYSEDEIRDFLWYEIRKEE